MTLLHPLIALALAALRVAGVKDQIFQAAAHSYVTALLIAAWYGDRRRKLFYWLAGLLTVVETACFVAGKMGWM